MTPGGDSFTQPCEMPTMPNLVGGSSASVSSGLTYYGRGQSPPWLRGHSPRSDPRSRFNDDRSSHGGSHYPTPPPPPRYSPPPQQYHPEEYSRGGEHNYGGGDGGNQYSRGGEHGGGGGNQYSRGGEHQHYHGGGGGAPRGAMQHHFLNGVGGDGGDNSRGEGTFQKLTRKDLRAMGVQVEQEKTYHQTTLSQHNFSPVGDGDQEPIIVPEEVGGGENDDSVSYVSESQPRLEPPSAIDILAMEAHRRR